ncbi:MAG: hypothetical protein ABSG55_02710 [Dehalococcoidia bacterium]|jgi:hypothetical protein
MVAELDIEPAERLDAAPPNKSPDLSWAHPGIARLRDWPCDEWSSPHEVDTAPAPVQEFKRDYIERTQQSLCTLVSRVVAELATTEREQPVRPDRGSIRFNIGRMKPRHPYTAELDGKVYVVVKMGDDLVNVYGLE